MNIYSSFTELSICTEKVSIRHCGEEGAKYMRKMVEKYAINIMTVSVKNLLIYCHNTHTHPSFDNKTQTVKSFSRVYLTLMI